MITEGVRDGWAANIEVDGPNYRRSRLADPSDVLNYFSITAVYMNSAARLAGPNGWSGPGRTAPGPGSHHYPEVKGGALIALFYLPAGRISYDITPSY